jgi:hypothetical protein
VHRAIDEYTDFFTVHPTHPPHTMYTKPLGLPQRTRNCKASSSLPDLTACHLGHLNLRVSFASFYCCGACVLHGSSTGLPTLDRCLHLLLALASACAEFLVALEPAGLILLTFVEALLIMVSHC